MNYKKSPDRPSSMGRQTFMKSANGEQFSALGGSREDSCACYEERSCADNRFRCNCDKRKRKLVHTHTLRYQLYIHPTPSCPQNEINTVAPILKHTRGDTRLETVSALKRTTQILGSRYYQCM